MAEIDLTRDERLALKGRAHHLNPVVLLGAAGLSEAVIKEIDRALAAHELIKIRVPGEDRGEREALFADLADRLGAARVQLIGKLLVLYRPKPDQTPEKNKPAPARATRPAPMRGAKPGRAEIRRTDRRVAPRRNAGRSR
jgi:putative YhbY family RNA-binding protein